MFVVVPEILALRDGTTVPENDAPIWQATTGYKNGDRVLRNHYLYACLAKDGETVTGVDPLHSFAGTLAKWQPMGTSNCYACLDWYTYTQTTAPAGSEDMTLVATWPRGSTAFALFNLDGVTAHVTIRNGADTYFDQEYQLIADNDGWWDYYFGETVFKKNIVVTGILPGQATIAVTIRGPRPALGMLVVGRQYDLGRRNDDSGYGKTQLGATVRTVDYSTQEMDELGTVTHVPRFITGRISVELAVHPTDVNRVTALLAKVKTIPALWLADNGTGSDPLNIFGFAKDVDNTYEGPAQNIYRITIEGIA